MIRFVVRSQPAPKEMPAPPAIVTTIVTEEEDTFPEPAREGNDDDIDQAFATYGIDLNSKQLGDQLNLVSSGYHLARQPQERSHLTSWLCLDKKGVTNITKSISLCIFIFPGNCYYFTSLKCFQENCLA